MYMGTGEIVGAMLPWLIGAALYVIAAVWIAEAAESRGCGKSKGALTALGIVLTPAIVGIWALLTTMPTGQILEHESEEQDPTC